jgi:hypothetical protein
MFLKAATDYLIRFNVGGEFSRARTGRQERGGNGGDLINSKLLN